MVATPLNPKISPLKQNGKSASPVIEDISGLVSKIATEPQPNPLSMQALKQALYQEFEVSNTAELRKNGFFRGLTFNMGKFDFRFKNTWKRLYRKFIGILPDERHEQGYGCINGINIFNYFRPWDVFSLDSKTATVLEIRQAYHHLAKIYHPDNPSTGDRTVFERLEVMYRSLLFARKKIS
ncbi:MAG: molecular chaperone DnaJ [Spirulina sp. SIO3F2]|nr:molecular chaperone DnaJ [Spirulina sp. SIO3F2]